MLVKLIYDKRPLLMVIYQPNLNKDMIPRPRKTYSPENCAFMQLRNGKIVGLALAVGKVYEDVTLQQLPKLDHFQPPAYYVKAERNVWGHGNSKDIKENRSVGVQIDFSGHAPVKRELTHEHSTFMDAADKMEQDDSDAALHVEVDTEKLDTIISNSNHARLENVIQLDQHQVQYLSVQNKFQSEECAEKIITAHERTVDSFNENVTVSSTPVSTGLQSSSVVIRSESQATKRQLRSFACSRKETVRLEDTVIRQHRKDCTRAPLNVQSHGYNADVQVDESSDSYELWSEGGVEQHAFADLSKKAHEVFLTRLSETIQTGFDDEVDLSYTTSSNVKTHTLSQDLSDCFSDDEDYKHFAKSNHVKWSQFRQWRREWYLNRFSHKRGATGSIHTMTYSRWYSVLLTYLVTCFLTIATVLRLQAPQKALRSKKSTSMFHHFLSALRQLPANIAVSVWNIIRKAVYVCVYICLLMYMGLSTVSSYIALRVVTFARVGGTLALSPFVRIYKAFTNLKSLVLAAAIDSLEVKLLSLRGESSDRVKPYTSLSKAEKNASIALWKQACCLGCPLFLICMLFCLLTVFGIVHLHQKVIALRIPRPEEVGLRHTHNIFVNFTTAKVPAWHVLPSSYMGIASTEALSDGSPIFLHLRNTDMMTTEHRVQVYDVLSSLGYHVLIPVFHLSRNDAINAWRWIKSKSQNSSVLLWGDNLDAQDMTTLAKDLCKEAMPPSGVVIEIPSKKMESKVTTLEVWSCNCTTTKAKFSDYYGYVKCPLPQDALADTEHLYTSISRCLNAVG